MRDQRSVVLHLVGQGEAGFSKPDPDRPELVHTRAGLELPLDRILFETVRQRRRAPVLMGESGAGKSAFLDAVANGLHLPEGLNPVRLSVRPDGDTSGLDEARAGSGPRRLFLVDSLDLIDPGNRRRFVSALVAAVEAAEADVWLVASRFGSFEATSLGGRILALRACCACPDSLREHRSVPDHHFQLHDLQRVPGITRGPSVAIDG